MLRCPLLKAMMSSCCGRSLLDTRSITTQLVFFKIDEVLFQRQQKPVGILMILPKLELGELYYDYYSTNELRKTLI